MPLASTAIADCVRASFALAFAERRQVLRLVVAVVVEVAAVVEVAVVVAAVEAVDDHRIGVDRSRVVDELQALGLEALEVSSMSS